MSKESMPERTCPICESRHFELFIHLNDYSISKESFSLLKCSSCELLITDPKPNDAELGRYYESDTYISHSDTKKGLINKLYHFGRNYMLDYKLKLIQQNVKEKNLLDIGAGTGYFLHHLNSKGYEVQGVEIDGSARAFAKQNFGLDIKDPGRLFDPYERKFDAISLWHVLEHLSELNRYMTRISDLLTEEGRLFISVPNHTALDARHYKEYWAGFDVPRHLWHFSPDNIQEFAQKHGLKLVATRFLPLDPFYNSLLSEKYKQGSFGMVKAGITGLRSWLKGLGNKNSASSPVYIFKTM